LANCAAHARNDPSLGQKQRKRFVLEVIFEPARGKLAALRSLDSIRTFQSLSSGREGAAYFLYNVPHSADSTLGVQVIAIGKPDRGWEPGRLPSWRKFARELQEQGRTVAILSRGYRSKPPPPLRKRLLNKLLLREDSTPPRIVSDGRNLLLDSETAGDEPYMLASNLKDVIVLVDKDRVKSGRYAIEKFGCDTLLLDDGFQYWKLRGRRRDIVLIRLPAAFRERIICCRAARSGSRPHTSEEPAPFSSPKSDGDTAKLRATHQQTQRHRGIIECVHHPA
jgi:tetraacyldisaccharide 4'-kinase